MHPPGRRDRKPHRRRLADHHRDLYDAAGLLAPAHVDRGGPRVPPLRFPRQLGADGASALMLLPRLGGRHGSRRGPEVDLSTCSPPGRPPRLRRRAADPEVCRPTSPEFATLGRPSCAAGAGRRGRRGRARPLASRRRPPAGPGTRRPPAPTSSRTHNRPDGGTSCPMSPVRSRSRRRQAVWPPPGGEELHRVPAKPGWLLSIPDAIRPARGARPAAPHPARHRAALRRRQGARRRAHADLRGRVRRQPEDASRGRSSCSSSRSTAAGPRSASRKERRARLVAELQKARLTGVPFKVPAETMSAKLANLPRGSR